MAKAISTSREKIDRLDEQIVELLGKRAEIAADICKAKVCKGVQYAYSPEREETIISNLVCKHKGKFPTKALNAIFTEVLSACRNIHIQDKVAVLGERFGWVHDAAMQHFGFSEHLTTMETQEELLEMLKEGQASLGFLALTTTSSDLRQILEAFLESRLHIISEVSYVQQFALVSRNTDDLSEINDIFVTRDTLKLLGQWVSSLPFPVTINICRSNEEVLENTVEGNPCAAILPEKISGSLELKPIKTGLEAITPIPYRCFVVAPEAYCIKGKRTKGSVLCVMNSRAEGLRKLLYSLTKRKLKLLGIEMFPFYRKAWSELFLVDFEVPEDVSESKKLLSEMELCCNLFRAIGEYPLL